MKKARFQTTFRRPLTFGIATIYTGIKAWFAFSSNKE
jgi:hypothetical protein